jgi:hypothetical protein
MNLYKINAVYRNCLKVQKLNYIGFNNGNSDVKYCVRFVGGAEVAQSVYCLVCRLDGCRFDPRQRQSIFPLASVSRPTLRPSQPPIHGYWGSFPGVKHGRGVTLTTHPHLVPR